jgi:hypothetical protein
MKGVAWELRDLSTEFNVRFSDLADLRAFGSSEGAASLLTMGGQPVLDCTQAAPQVGRRPRRGGYSDAVG